MPSNNLVRGLLNPRLQGIFDNDRQQQPQQQQGPQGLGGALGQLFGGASDPNLSEEENAQIGRQARMQAGLATILASQRGGNPVAALATGALIGQQAGGEARAKLVEESAARKRLASVAQALGSDMIDRSDVSKAIQIAVRAGDAETTGMLIDLMKTLPEPETNKVGMKLVTVDGESFLADEDVNLFDPFTREPVTSPPADKLEPGGRFREDIYDAESGTIRSINFITDEQGRVVGQQDLGQAEAPAVLNEGDLAGMANQLRSELTTLEGLIAEHGVPNEIQVRLPNRVQGKLGPWIQQYEAAGGKINIMASRMMFGARVSDDERKALSEVLTPRPGDSDVVVAQKMRGLNMLIDDFEKQQGIYNESASPGDGTTSRYTQNIPGAALSTFSY